MRIPFALAILAAGACASPTPEVPAQKLALEQEINGFRTAVVDVCLASALAGKPVAELATETGPIVAVSPTGASAGDSVWAPRDAEGVLIRSNQTECQVTARSPSNRAALATVEEALNDPHGFVAETRSSGVPAGNIYKRYTKKVGEQTFHVTLADPDATPGRTLVATVTATPPRG